MSTPTDERLVVEARVEHVLPVGAQVDISFNFANGFFFDFEIERRLCCLWAELAPSLQLSLSDPTIDSGAEMNQTF